MKLSNRAFDGLVAVCCVPAIVGLLSGLGDWWMYVLGFAAGSAVLVWVCR